MEHMSGSYALLKALPLGLTAAVLFFLCIGILHIGRERSEGLPYNVAWSSEIGDPFLICYVLTGIAILQRPGTVLGNWQVTFQFWAAILGAISAVAAQAMAVRGLARGPKLMDAYHNFVIVPLLVFLIISFLPVIWFSGTWMERQMTCGLVFIWAGLVLYDIANYRLDQRSWLMANGVPFPW
jgi:hypothetical protein